jgi:hypothetical protein
MTFLSNAKQSAAFTIRFACALFAYFGLVLCDGTDLQAYIASRETEEIEEIAPNDSS